MASALATLLIRLSERLSIRSCDVLRWIIELAESGENLRNRLPPWRRMRTPLDASNRIPVNVGQIAKFPNRQAFLAAQFTNFRPDVFHVKSIRDSLASRKQT